MSEPGKAVFLSYASQDAEAAQSICEALRGAGVEVWFDQSELVGGDQWDGKIRGQISSCALFVPLISANTQARLEGYFRIEWKLAARRTHAMASAKAFLVPIVIDDTHDAGAHVPDEFREVQWTRLPRGENAIAFVARVKKLVAGDGRLGSGDVDLRVADQASRLPRPRRDPRKWLRPLFAAALIFAAVLAIALVKRSAPTAPGHPSPLAVATKTHGSRPEVAQLLERVRATTAKFEDILHTELDSMEELLGQAAKLDPADASIWAQWAMVDCRYLNHSFDQTPARRDAARRHAAQAAGLDPDRAEVRLAQADVMMTLSKDATRAEATRILRPLLTETPADGRVPLLLGWLAFDTTRPEAALAWFEQATQVPGYALAGHFAKARMLYWSGRISEAEAELNRALAVGTSAEVLLWKALLFATWRGDLSAARRTLAEVPPQSFVEDMPAATRYWVELLSRNYEQALAALRMVPHDYLQSDVYRGPAGYLSGVALAEAGKKAAAELEWRSALTTVDSRLRAEPNGRELMEIKALLQARLGDLEAGGKTFRAVQELYGSWGSREVPLQLQFLPAEEAYAWAAGKVAEGHGAFTTALLQLDPVFAGLRSDPRFPALLAQAEADPRLSPNAGAKQAAGEISDKIEAKSVAVLAFANLSDDKANEYFSDGISEELLNVLAKIPGLKVSARTSAFYFKGKEVPIPEIAKQLGVAYVVEGSVRKSADRVRITAELIKAADGFQVWSDTFTRDVRDIFAVQDEIAGLIAENLKLKMGDIPRVTRTVNPEAHRLVLEGRHFWNLRTTEGFARAEAAFTGAIELDPQFAEAHAGLADNFQIRAQYKMLDGVGGEAVDQERAWTEGQIAFRLDPSLPETNAALAYLLHNQGKLVEAEGYYKKAFALNPNYATAHLWHGQWLDAYGRLDAAIAENRLACELDPLGFIILDRYAQHLALARRYQEALAMNERAAALRTDLWMPNVGERALILFALGRNKEAVEAARAVRQNPTSWPRWTADADALWVLSQSGLAEEAGAYAAELLQKLAEKSYVRGFVLIYTGRFDEAMPYLERSPVLMRRPLFWDPRLDQWREDPRFHQLLAKLGCAEEYKVARDTLARMLKDQATKK